MKVNKIKEAFDSFLEKKVVPLDKKIIIALFALVIILPTAAFYFLHYTAKTEEIKRLESRETQLRKEITEAKKIAAKLDEHLAEMEETKRLFAEASILLPQKKDIPGLLTNISALGTNSGLNMATFSPGGDAPEKRYPRAFDQYFRPWNQFGAEHGHLLPGGRTHKRFLCRDTGFYKSKRSVP
jgi:type IV pilus assembly protein PilO